MHLGVSTSSDIELTISRCSLVRNVEIQYCVSIYQLNASYSLYIFLGGEEGQNEKMNEESKHLIVVVVVDGMHCEKEFVSAVTIAKGDEREINELL